LVGSFGLKLLDHIDYKPNITALDIGFGTGFPLIGIALRLGKESTVYGIDSWKESVERAIEKIDYYNVSNIKIIEGTVESISLENNSVNLITSNNCINNVENMEKALMECSRVLKRNGRIISADFGSSAINSSFFLPSITKASLYPVKIPR
jgi:ubiquinone/menaquinone biosynthesis C-methylase UbiE